MAGTDRSGRTCQGRLQGLTVYDADSELARPATPRGVSSPLPLRSLANSGATATSVVTIAADRGDRERRKCCLEDWAGCPPHLAYAGSLGVDMSSSEPDLARAEIAAVCSAKRASPSSTPPVLGRGAAVAITPGRSPLYWPVLDDAGAAGARAPCADGDGTKKWFETGGIGFGPRAVKA